MNIGELWKQLGKSDKDTLIVGLICTLTLLGVSFGKAPLTTLFAGCVLILLYTVFRYAMENVQARERENGLRRSSQAKARKTIDATATKTEQDDLDKLRNRTPAKKRSP